MWRINSLRIFILTATFVLGLLAVAILHGWWNDGPEPSAEEVRLLRLRLFANHAVSRLPRTKLPHEDSFLTSSWRLRLDALRTLGVPSYWDSSRSSHAAIIAGLLERALDNTIIVMYGTGGLEEFMANAVCHWARLRMENYVIFTTGAVLQSLRAHPALAGVPTAAVLDISEVFGTDISGSDGYHNFDTAGFASHTRVKFLIAELMVQLGLHAIIQDTDVIPLQDYRPHILAEACSAVMKARQIHSQKSDVKKFHIASTQEFDKICTTSDYTGSAERGELFALDTAPFIFTQLEMPNDRDFPDKSQCNCNHNTGFFFIRSSYFSVFAMRHLIRMLEHDNVASTDQRIFGEFIRGWGSLLDERVASLSFDLFPSGKDWVPGKESSTALIIHANWIFGLQMKRKKIFRAGLLLWDSSSRACLLE